jgi:hypothetical protein
VAGLDGKIYVIGGKDELRVVQNTVFAYDPGNDTWQIGSPLEVPVEAPQPVFRSDLRAAVGPDDRIYVAGGKDGDGNDRCEVYALNIGQNPATWAQVASLKTCRSHFGLAQGSNRALLAAGGFSNNTVLNSMESINPLTDKEWRVEPNTLLEPTEGMGFTVEQDGNFLSVGGFGVGQVISKLVQEIDVVPDLIPHTVTFHLHGATDEPGDYGGLRMDQQEPLFNQPISLDLLSQQSWFSFPSLTGTFGAGAEFTVTFPCSLGLSAFTTITLSATDIQGGHTRQLGQAILLLEGCAPVKIPINGPLKLNDEELQLTISSGVGLQTSLSPGQHITLEATNFTGTPGNARGVTVKLAKSLP